jgi:hypothetical protein
MMPFVGRYEPAWGIVQKLSWPNVNEAKMNWVCAEGAFLKDVLSTMNCKPKLQRSLTSNRIQALRVLYACAAPRAHLFFSIDEAQEIHESELCWLKSIINWLVRRDCLVTVLAFGQQELLTMREALMPSARSDLDGRYTNELYEFEIIRNATDLSATFAACDTKSEFPPDIGYSYTHFWWPRAFEHGFRLMPQGAAAWTAFINASPNTHCANGISMRWVAKVLAELAQAKKDADAASFEVDEAMLVAAIRAAGFMDLPSVQSKRRKGKSRP